MSSVTFAIRGLLARHLGRAPESIRARHSLEEDLDLTPLELVLVAVELEELEGVELDVTGLSNVQRVGDLYAYVRRAVGRARRMRRQMPNVA